MTARSSWRLWSRAARRIAHTALAAAPLAFGAPASGGPAQIPAPAPTDWFHIVEIDPTTFAISEPKYWQQNVSYLLVGKTRAILFDTGPGIYSIRPTVERLTRLPVLVIPSHLHFDHVGRIEEFERIALLGTRPLRAQVRGQRLVETAAQYMLQQPVSFRVDRWLKDGETIDLGDRPIRILNTPGHTPESIALADESRQRLFTGDLVNRMVTLYDVPGSRIEQSAKSLERLLKVLPVGGLAFEAHAETPITRDELAQLAVGTRNIADGRAASQAMCLGGLPMRRFDIGAFSVVLPPESGESLHPLVSNVEVLDWQGGACASAP